MNRKVFFAAVRDAPFGGFLTSGQVDGLTKILDEWDRRALTDIRWLAYVLATTFHETGRKMQPIPEGGGDTYLRAKSYYPWYGRGLIQCTWQANFAKFGCTNPDEMLQWPMALKALFDGMIKGMFTGSALPHWFSPTVDDPVNARRIVNGTDKAQTIAGYHREFLAAIKAAKAAPAPAPVKQVIIPPVITPAPKPKQGLWAWLFGKKA